VYELTDRGKSVWETIRANELSV